MVLNRMFASRGGDSVRTATTAICVLAAVLVSACGGGGDSGRDVASPPPPPSSPPPPSLAQSGDAGTALALYEVAAVHSSMATSPLDNFAEGLRASCVAQSGSFQFYLDGSSPAPGTELPTGSHTFAATYTNCLVDGLVGIMLNGTASGTYTRAGVNDLSAQVSLSSMRGTLLALYSHLYDVTANGSGAWAVVPAGNAYTKTYTPAVGSTLVNNLTTNVATFEGGTYSFSYDSTSQSTRDDFNTLAVAINGTSYQLDGGLQASVGTGHIVYLSGEVRISSGKGLVARLYPGQGGALGIEILGSLVSF